MKNGTTRHVLFVAAILGIASVAAAQGPSTDEVYFDPASTSLPQLTRAELGDLAAPVALYPDSLLSQVLVASTYPLEVVQAHQWLQRNGHLEGPALMEAARQQPWDPSVQGLVAFPDVLAMLSEDVRWTTSLGDAFLAQEADLMYAVQELRGRAQGSGRLVSTPQQTVSTVVQEGRTVIEIVPADPLVIYVPRYDPYWIWGAPAWVAYPRLSYGYRYGFGYGVDVGFWFGGWSWSRGWGWGPNWWGGSLWVDPVFFRHCGYRYRPHRGYYGRHPGRGYGGTHAGGHPGRDTWRHDTAHRRGVPYAGGREAGRNRGGTQVSASTMGGPAPPRRAGNLSASPSGDRAVSPGSGRGRDEGWRNPDRTTAPSTRGAGPEQARRTGSRAYAPGPGSAGPDQGWRTRTEAGASGTRSVAPDPAWRRGEASIPAGTRRAAPEPAWRTGPGSGSPSPRGAGADRGWNSSSRGPGPQSRGPEASPRGSAPPPRSSAMPPRAAAPSSGYSAPQRSSSTGGGARAHGTSTSRSSAGSGPSRGSSGGRDSSGRSGEGPRRH